MFKKSTLTVSRDEWDDLKADVRGLKRLAGIEEEQRTLIDARLGAAIDELERRIAAQVERVAELSNWANNAPETFRLQVARIEGAVARLSRDIAAEQAARVELTRRFDALLLSVTEHYAKYETLAARVSAPGSGHGVESAAGAKLADIAAVAAAAPEPDVEAMRAFYEEKRAAYYADKRAEREQNTPERSGTAREAPSDDQEAQPAARLSERCTHSHVEYAMADEAYRCRDCGANVEREKLPARGYL